MSYVLVVLATLLAIRIWTKRLNPRWVQLQAALRQPLNPERMSTPSREVPSSTGTNREYSDSPKPKRRKVRPKSNDPYSHGFSAKPKAKLNKPN